MQRNFVNYIEFLEHQHFLSWFLAFLLNIFNIMPHSRKYETQFKTVDCLPILEIACNKGFLFSSLNEGVSSL